MAEDIGQAGPWQDYQAQPTAQAAGPWSDYAEPTATDNSLGSIAEAAGRGALRNFPFGQQVAAAAAPINPFSDKPTYSEEIKHLTEAAEASKAAHKAAYGTGAVIGTALPLAIPGIGEALTAESLPAAMAANAAAGAIGSQSDTNLTKFSGQNAKEAAISAGIGAAMPVAFNGLGKLLGSEGAQASSVLSEGESQTAEGLSSEAGPHVPASALEEGSLPGNITPKEAFVKAQNDYNNNLLKLNQLREEAHNAGNGAEFDRTMEDHPLYQAVADASERANKSADDLLESGMTNKDIDALRFEQPTAKSEPVVIPNKAVAPDFRPSAERVYASNIAQGLGGTPRQLMRVFGKENPIQSLNEIGNWMDTAGPNGTSLHGLMDRPGELLEKVDAVHDSAGKTIGGIIDDLAGKEGAKINQPVNLVELKSELQNFADRTADPQTEARVLKLIRTVDSLGEKDLTGFDILQQIKEMTGKQIPKDPEMSQIYGSLADRMNKIVDAYGEAIDNPQLRAAYDKAKIDYHNSSRLLPLLRYSEARELVGGPAGHASLRSLLGSIINIGSSVTGLPPAEQMGRNVMLKTAPLARNLANARLGAANKMSPAAMLELSNALSTTYNKNKKGAQ